MTSPPGRSPWGIAPSSDSGRQESSASLPSLSSGIELLLEGGMADAGQGIVEALSIAALLQVGGNDVVDGLAHLVVGEGGADRSEEHTSELQSLMRRSYAVFCLK